MKTNFSLLFYMKKPKNYQKGVAPTYLRITVNGNRAEVTTGRSCEPSRWNARAGRATGMKREWSEIIPTSLFIVLKSKG